MHCLRRPALDSLPPAASIQLSGIMPATSGFAVKCGRCGVLFATHNCAKLDHFGIYRVTCPQCRWPGRYFAAELRPLKPGEPLAPAAAPAARKRPA